ncbi:rod-binding protein [Actibacterium sp. 188UL27-1]|uniref:rod-binding protein n=1 Tax=Actibacterium sp. 188UL27-1 TaxID=2786961 RepID=UPI00351C2AD3
MHKLQELAVDMEAVFLTEMLKHTGLGTARDGFGGGIGEEQFSGFLLQEQARALAERGGLGLAESIFDAIKAYEGE